MHTGEKLAAPTGALQRDAGKPTPLPAAGLRVRQGCVLVSGTYRQSRGETVGGWEGRWFTVWG